MIYTFKIYKVSLIDNKGRGNNVVISTFGTTK